MTPLQQEVDQLAATILRSLVEQPDDCDSREPLWMRRENLRAQLHAGAHSSTRWSART
jgi:hypothetical protein